MRLFLRFLFILLGIVIVILVFTITTVDRTPYQDTDFYAEMDQRLDSLSREFRLSANTTELQIGWDKVNITPLEPLPLAGYGARDPKLMQGVGDSSFVRTVVFRKGKEKVAFIAADLLIIHPEVSTYVYANLPKDWAADELFFTATHTHSGMGGWAPGLVGELFAGEYEEDVVARVGDQIIRSITDADQSLASGQVAYGDIVVEEAIRNRVIKDGAIDSALRMLLLQKDSALGIINFYAAHATCLSYDTHQLSGDYPALLNRLLENEARFDFAAFAAGAVGSMGPEADEPGAACVDFIASTLSQQAEMFSLITNAATTNPLFLQSFRLKMPARDPHFKVSENLAVRPYLFREAFGDYPNHISVLLLGETVLIGMPCDFSGELAAPLYEKARSLGLNLIITSFNGGYMGYVIKDEHYDLPNYEARTMSWYGPDAGAYLSEVVSRILDTIGSGF